MDNNPPTPFTDPHRPDLKPVDPRATASPTNDFEIAGSIDNQNTFNPSSGSTPVPH
jgi:hypothetical protein